MPALHRGVCGLLLSLLVLAPCDARAERPFKPVVLASPGFLYYHPDLRHRKLGVEAHERADYAEATEQFLKAARYADKASQGMLAEIHWLGRGGPVQRPQAYVWMDLAAERGSPFFVARREAYWHAMGADEQADALRIGEAMYAEYGDAVAQPRIESKLRKGRMASTGSRVYPLSQLIISLRTQTGDTVRTRGHEYYHPDLWMADDYFAWQDREWARPQTGIVDVGPLRADVAVPDEAGDD